MWYRSFGKLGWSVSSIGMGTWNIGNQWGELDDATSWATVRAALDAGITLFDTAESYGVPNGLSEERLGQALSGVRQRVTLVSKIGHWGARTGQGVPKTSVDMIRLCAHASLHRLRTDYHDVMLCHEGNIEDPSIYLEAFEMLVQRGRLRAYGVSTNNLDVLKRFNVDGNCSVVEANYSLLNRQPEEAFLPYCEENGIAVLIRGPLRRGLLAGKYDRETVFTDQVRSVWSPGGSQRESYLADMVKLDKVKGAISQDKLVDTALKYVISGPASPVAIPGAKSPHQARMNAAAGDHELSAEELAVLRSLTN